MLSKFLDPKNDYAFKRIFGSEKNKDILIHFLNDIITFEERAPITEVTFLKPIQDPDIASKKTSIVDILCKDAQGSQYIVEMQVAKQKGFEKRAMYYAAKAYISQMYAGGKYEDLKEVIFLAISDFIIFPNKKEYKSEHVILDKKAFDHFLKDFSFTFLELPKFKKQIDELSTITEKWMYFFKHAAETSEADLKRLIGQDLIIERAYEELNQLSWSDIERLTYDDAQKKEWDYNAVLRQKLDDGIAAGWVRGIEKGFAKGMKKGMKQGMEEGKIEIVKNMIAKRVDMHAISDLTGLTIEELRSLLIDENETSDEACDYKKISRK